MIPLRAIAVSSLCVLLCLIAGCSSTSKESSIVGDVGGDDVAETSTEDLTMPYTLTVFDNTRINSHGDQENFQNAFADVDLINGPFSNVTLTIDLETTCFPFEEWTAPPSGERWPADCDAFDRNFEFILDPATDPEDPPGIELVRAITPFGGPLHIEVDVTDVANARQGLHTIQAHITTWSDGAGQVSGSNGGWSVSAQLDVTPGPMPNIVLALIPLMNTSLGVDQGEGSVSFTVPSRASRTRLEYRTTGHGGGSDSSSACIGPAEEFCRRSHSLSLNDAVFYSATPWRDDCAELCTRATNDLLQGEYCAENPTGAIQSVEAPRANWCPGSVTPPFTKKLGSLDAGEHTFGYKIEGIYEGGSWRTSAMIFLFE